MGVQCCQVTITWNAPGFVPAACSNPSVSVARPSRRPSFSRPWRESPTPPSGGCWRISEDTEHLPPKCFRLRHSSTRTPLNPHFPSAGIAKDSSFTSLRTSGEEDLEAVFAKLAAQNPAAIDLNLGCPAPEIQQQASGAALFRDFKRLKQVLKRIRACYRGTLTVKVPPGR